MSATELRRIWPEVLAEVKSRRRFTYMMLSQNAQVLDVADGALVLGFANTGAKEAFGTSGSLDVLADCLIQVIGMEFRIQTVLANGAQGDQEESRPLQRPAGQKPAAPEPVAEPTPSEPPPEMDVDVAEDDARLADADATAAGLLTEAFGAEVIDVTSQER